MQPVSDKTRPAALHAGSAERERLAPTGPHLSASISRENQVAIYWDGQGVLGGMYCMLQVGAGSFSAGLTHCTLCKLTGDVTTDLHSDCVVSK